MISSEKIQELAGGIDEHLRRLESFTSLLKDIKISLETTLRFQEKLYLNELEEVKKDLAEIKEQLKKRGLPLADQYERDLKDIRVAIDGTWPDAVEDETICDNDDKASYRAACILDLLVGEHLKGKKFLDFGCGQGHTIPQALEREAALAFGYDINLSNLKFKPDNFSTDFAEVRRRAPFDVILLHDVLDHSVILSPTQILEQVRSVVADGGRVYIRNHPWSGRHGGHLYTQKNKAFLHLVLDDVELLRLGGWRCEPNIKVALPVETYRTWFAQTRFNIVSEVIIKDKVEDFFLNPSPVCNRIQKHFANPETMINQLEISFVEYVLEPQSNHQIF